jgi:radical SAM superfamily enzyme YgiQ (UPF0313 family)
MEEREHMGSQHLDLLLVTPPSRIEVYQELSNVYAAIEPPVWSGLIAHFIREHGYFVQMLDAEAEGLTHDQTAQRIADADPGLVVYMIYGQQPSASTQCMPGGRKVGEKVRTLTDRPSLVIGTHASALPERTLREEPYTYVCRGEGPYTVLGLLEHLKGKRSLAEVPGLGYWDDGAVKVNNSASKIKDLDTELPMQTWDLLDMSLYRPHNWQALGNIATRGGYVSIQTSLGCPYKCTFCCINAPFNGAGIRYWSPEVIIKQIDHVVETYGIKTIKIPDEMFVLNKRHVLGICDLLIERDYGLNIWAYARIDTVQPDFLEKLRAAGFQWLGIGIESASKFVRDGTLKGRFGNEDIKHVIADIRGAEINVSGNYIFGLPDDDDVSMRETFDLALRLNTEWANFYSAMAYPGSPLYDFARQRGWLLPDDVGGPGWIGYSQHGYDTLPLPTNKLTGVKVLEFRDQAFNKYFTSDNYLSMIGRRFGPEAAAHLREMTKIKIRRRHHDDPMYYERLLRQRGTFATAV